MSNEECEGFDRIVLAANVNSMKDRITRLEELLREAIFELKVLNALNSYDLASTSRLIFKIVEEIGPK